MLTFHVYVNWGVPGGLARGRVNGRGLRTIERGMKRQANSRFSTHEGWPFTSRGRKKAVGYP